MRVIIGLDSMHTLLDLISVKKKDFYVSNINLLSAAVDPRDIARRDQMEFFIEKTLDANLRDEDYPHSYLQEKKFTRSIPSKFR